MCSRIVGGAECFLTHLDTAAGIGRELRQHILVSGAPSSPSTALTCSSGRRATRLQRPLMAVRITRRGKAFQHHSSSSDLPVMELGTRRAKTFSVSPK